MRTTTYRRATEVETSREDLIGWHGRPGAFERLAPPWTPTEVVERTGRPLEPGSRLGLRVKVGPFWRSWVAEHGECVPGAAFHDRQISGPFAVWEHAHRFEPVGAATRLEDVVRYALPFGVLGRLGAAYARQEIDRMFAYRHCVTARDIRFHARYGGEAMKVLMTGSSGLVGRALRSFLGGGGHQVRRLLRTASASDDAASWNQVDGTFAAGAFEGIDAVVHLAGESIAGGRWTAARKARIRDSRVIGTRQLCEALAGLDTPPKVLVAASAIGFYGDRGNKLLDESAGPGSGFLPEVCQAWEAEVGQARERGIRVVNLRIGIVLSPLGGALAQMLLPFKLGVGGVLGGGAQYMSWIALDDLLGIVLHVLTDDSVSGPVNAVAPQAVTNREFTKTLGAVLSRPTVLPVPAVALRIALGEMADALLLASTRVDPAVLRTTDFEFAYPHLEGALRHVLGRG